MSTMCICVTYSFSLGRRVVCNNAFWGNQGGLYMCNVDLSLECAEFVNSYGW